MCTLPPTLTYYLPWLQLTSRNLLAIANEGTAAGSVNAPSSQELASLDAILGYMDNYVIAHASQGESASAAVALLAIDSIRESLASLIACVVRWPPLEAFGSRSISSDTDCTDEQARQQLLLTACLSVNNLVLASLQPGLGPAPAVLDFGLTLICTDALQCCSRVLVRDVTALRAHASAATAAAAAAPGAADNGGATATALPHQAALGRLSASLWLAVHLLNPLALLAVQAAEAAAAAVAALAARTGLASTSYPDLTQMHLNAALELSPCSNPELHSSPVRASPSGLSSDGSSSSSTCSSSTSSTSSISSSHLAADYSLRFATALCDSQILEHVALGMGLLVEGVFGPEVTHPGNLGLRNGGNHSFGQGDVGDAGADEASGATGGAGAISVAGGDDSLLRGGEDGYLHGGGAGPEPDMSDSAVGGWGDAGGYGGSGRSSDGIGGGDGGHDLGSARCSEDGPAADTGSSYPGSDVPEDDGDGDSATVGVSDALDQEQEVAVAAVGQAADAAATAAGEVSGGVVAGSPSGQLLVAWSSLVPSLTRLAQLVNRWRQPLPGQTPVPTAVPAALAASAPFAAALPTSMGISDSVRYLQDALSGDCLRTLVLAAALAALRAADGHPSYGLPSSAALGLLKLSAPGLYPFASGGGSVAAGAPSPLCVGLVNDTFLVGCLPSLMETWVATMRRQRLEADLEAETAPQSGAEGPGVETSGGGGGGGRLGADEALVVLLRIGRLVVTSARARDQNAGQQEHAGTQGGAQAGCGPVGCESDTAAAAAAAQGGGAATPWRLLLPAHVGGGALLAVLQCARRHLPLLRRRRHRRREADPAHVADSDGGGGGAAAAATTRAHWHAEVGWWRLAVDAARHMVRCTPTNPMTVSELRELGALMREAVLGSRTDLQSAAPSGRYAQGLDMAAPTVPEGLSPTPPAGIGAALEAGGLPCLERLLRRAGEEPAGPEAQVVLGLLRPAAAAAECLGRLLAYGDAAQGAALLATLTKVLRRLQVPLVEDLAAAAAAAAAESAAPGRQGSEEACEDVGTRSPPASGPRGWAISPAADLALAVIAVVYDLFRVCMCWLPAVHRDTVGQPPQPVRQEETKGGAVITRTGGGAGGSSPEQHHPPPRRDPGQQLSCLALYGACVWLPQLAVLLRLVAPDLSAVAPGCLEQLYLVSPGTAPAEGTGPAASAAAAAPAPTTTAGANPADAAAAGATATALAGVGAGCAGRVLFLEVLSRIVLQLLSWLPMVAYYGGAGAVVARTAGTRNSAAATAEAEAAASDYGGGPGATAAWSPLLTELGAAPLLGSVLDLTEQLWLAWATTGQGYGPLWGLAESCYWVALAQPASVRQAGWDRHRLRYVAEVLRHLGWVDRAVAMEALEAQLAAWGSEVTEQEHQAEEEEEKEEKEALGRLLAGCPPDGGAHLRAAAKGLAAPGEARRLLPMCGNLCCTNLTGESEAEVPLTRPGGGVYGSRCVRYCSTACRAAHLRVLR